MAVILGGILSLRAEITPEDIRQLQTRFQQAEESEERLRARIQKLEATIAELRSQLGEVRSVAASAGKDAVTQEQLKKVVDQLRDLDRRRQDDNEKVVQQIKRLADLPTAPPPSFDDPKPRGRKPSGEPSVGAGGNGGEPSLIPSLISNPSPRRTCPSRRCRPIMNSMSMLSATTNR